MVLRTLTSSLGDSQPSHTISQEYAPAPDASEPILSNGRRWLLLGIFCLAQFIDVYASSGTIVAIPAVSAVGVKVCGQS